MPDVSVIIPVYGAEKHIARCVRSLFGQTLDSMEFIFIDDCSPDNSISIMQKVLEEYPQRKDQVKIIRHEVNQGVGAARNHGVAACSGNYIIHCDSDDWADHDLYEKMYARAVAFEADVVCCPFITEFADSRTASMTFPQETGEAESYIFKNVGRHLNTLWSKLYKKEIAQDQTISCPDAFCMGEDLLRNIQMLDKCKNISFISDSFYHYRQNAASITHNFTEKHFNNLNKIIKLLDKTYHGKYAAICFNLKSNMFLGTLMSLRQNDGAAQRFKENWKKLSLMDKFRIISAATGSFKGKAALSAACVSPSLTVFILQRILSR